MIRHVEMDFDKPKAKSIIRENAITILSLDITPEAISFSRFD